MDYINAFWGGGLICALAQILLDRTKMMPGRVMVSLVVLGCILGFVQIFKPLQEYAGAGVSVPLLGFGNTLWPLSRKNYPKQFLNICEGRSLLQDTIVRNMPFVDEFIITIIVHKEHTQIAQNLYDS